MFYKILLWLFAITSFFLSYVLSYEMNMTEYFKMPNLYDFDDYDRCLQEYNELSTYCFVRAKVLPKNNSEAWDAIVDISKYDKHHFDHRYLYFGICLNWCQSVLDQVGNETAEQLYTGLLTNDTKINFNILLNIFEPYEAENRRAYNRMVNQCINLRLKERNDLRSLTAIEYCNSNNASNSERKEKDNWNLTFYCILCLLILLATFSSFYDFSLKLKRRDKLLTDRDHYKAPVSGKVKNIFVSFSIPRNWYRLTQDPNGRVACELRFLDCFKFCAMFLVIFAHSVWIFYESGITNPQDPERMSHTVGGTVLVSGVLVTLTFFVISGFLLTNQWIKFTDTHTNLRFMGYVMTYLKYNAFRYIRLTIPYAFVILLSGVYFDNPGGPLWRHIYEREQLFCRKNWWINLLYLNNHMRTDERCLRQGWYLAADAHCFMLSLLILIIGHKFPKIRNWLFGTILATFFVLPGIVVYVKKYTPIFIAAPELQRDSFIGNPEDSFYVDFDMNFGCYFSGVIAAYVYDKISRTNLQLRNYIGFQVFWYALIGAGVGWLFIAHPFFQNYYDEPPMFWDSVFAMLHRNMWAFGLSAFIVGMANKVGWIFRQFACYPVFKVLGRLTYGAFLLNLLIARLVLASNRQPIYFGTGIMFALVIFNATVSYLMSLLLAIFLELPMSSLLKLFKI